MKTQTFEPLFDGNWKSPWVGFVYEVTEISTGKLYIGKKHFYSKKTLPGKTNKTRVESDWKTYATSNKYLKPAIKKNPDNYSFRILYLCRDDSILSYLENKEMMERGALESDKFYNGNLKMNVMSTYVDFDSRFLKI